GRIACGAGPRHGGTERSFPEMNWTLLETSLLASALTTLLSLVFGFLAALFVSALESGWRRGFLSIAVVALALPPFLVTGCWLHLLGLSGVGGCWLPLS